MTATSLHHDMVNMSKCHYVTICSIYKYVNKPKCHYVSTAVSHYVSVISLRQRVTAMMPMSLHCDTN